MRRAGRAIVKPSTRAAASASPPATRTVRFAVAIEREIVLRKLAALERCEKRIHRVPIGGGIRGEVVMIRVADREERLPAADAVEQSAPERERDDGVMVPVHDEDGRGDAFCATARA